MQINSVTSKTFRLGGVAYVTALSGSFQNTTIYKPSGSEASSEQTSKWQYYKMLLFLHDIVKPRKTISNVSMVGDVKDCGSTPSPSTTLSPCDNLNSNQSPSANKRRKRQHEGDNSISQQLCDNLNSNQSPSANKRRKRQHEGDNSISQQLLNAINETNHIPDDTDAFCTRLAASLRRIPRRERSQLEIKFLQMVYEVEDTLSLFDD
ncbi:hypothetical protein QE152_g4137 [Popillia japonica]|uniref:BESS domain-containing protein n=1 Tax=Popillia japonica TaxID=7064 RepID=A0AAW1N2J6_POPJA